MMLGAGFLIVAGYFRVVWDIRFIPAFAVSPLAQLLFYPAVTLPEAATSPLLHQWALRLTLTGAFGLRELWVPTLYLERSLPRRRSQLVGIVPAQGERLRAFPGGDLRDR